MIEQVRNILVDNLGVERDKIQLETTLEEELGLDSIDMFNLVDLLEEQYQIKIEGNTSLKTVGDIVTVFENK